MRGFSAGQISMFESMGQKELFSFRKDSLDMQLNTYKEAVNEELQNHKAMTINKVIDSVLETADMLETIDTRIDKHSIPCDYKTLKRTYEALYRDSGIIDEDYIKDKFGLYYSTGQSEDITLQDLTNGNDIY